MISTLSAAQRSGQRLMVGFDGTSMNKDLEFLIGTIKVGGVILFSRNLGTPEEIRRLCTDMQEYAKSHGEPQLLIAIDQEGGQVARLKAPFFTEFSGNPSLKNRQDALSFASVVAMELKAIGVNMNYAPVLDIAPTDFPSIMAKRSFGSDPALVSELGIAVIEAFQENSILAVAKHFPGIGKTILDSHVDLPVVKEDMASLEACDLIPFRAAIQKKVEGIMLSHILYEKIDPIWPASLSPVIARDLLRRKMEYNGLVMTDDLDMGAIARHYDLETSIYQALLSEIDQILICHKGPAIEKAFEHILKLTRDNSTLDNLSKRSVERILSAKNVAKPYIYVKSHDQ